MAIEVRINTVAYPYTGASAIRDDGVELDISGNYYVTGESADAQQEELKVALMRRAKRAFGDYDNDQARRSKESAANAGLSPLVGTSASVPAVPIAPTVGFSVSGANLRISGNIGPDTVKVTVAVDGIAVEVQMGPAAYRAQVAKPTGTAAVVVTAINLLGEATSTEATYSAT